MAFPSILPEQPGKIIAVHVAFESRAAQRGRRPRVPSYFLKATSSLAESGGTLARPAGTELLAFEGEIALIIGAPTKDVSLEEAWKHVAFVTASNDVGLYDYRAADKGSNTRSKSRDGYTPIGPRLIDAQAIDPKQLRLRTWVNGELVQEGDTSDAEMIFPLAQFVADLSQHLTLETGDIILTGTPAGSTVIVPGDVVEVEVDVPGESSSGRLSSTVVESTADFDPAIGDLPSVDDKQREDAYGDRAAAGLPPLTSSEPDPESSPELIPELTPELRSKLEAVPTAGLSAELRRRGINQSVIEGVYPQTPGTKMVGIARTLRFLAGREDLFKTHGGGLNAQKQVFDTVRAGEVIVIEARREAESGTLGDILALRAKVRGAAGVVTDGGVRDYSAVKEIGLPVFTQGAHPCVLGRRHVPWDSDVAISCGNATVVPGDVIVGDDDGVIVIPRSIAAEVAEEALAKERQDEWVAQRVESGESLDGLFPPTGDNKQAYEDFLNSGDK
ncbi:fumarylacetoacetate hydrolase family protein [Corynebacterium flavescens]|uniref:fumarylacetoacetate hydrolase family protein n=1 Tax=Corynebacterium flavescens TaxID=28028 RepID=UPI000ED87B52|nr:fumarylacetoacetate hydrolase family protein [Corynebacterium flavescens]